MGGHQADDTDALDAAIASLQDQLDFLVKIFRALDDKTARRTASRAEYQDTVLQQISDLTQTVIELMERRQASGGPDPSSGLGSRTTIPPPGEPPGPQDAVLMLMRNVPLEETERDRLLAAEKAEAIRKKAFQERLSQLRAAREGRLAARAGRFLRRCLGFGSN